MWNKILSKISLAFFLTVFVFCSYQVINHVYESKQQDNQLTEISKITSRVTAYNMNVLMGSETELISLEKVREDHERAKVFLSHQYLKEENDDYIGWILISDTNIDYPVLQNKEYPEYYLKRNFNKKKSSYGSIYMDSSCIINSSRNYVIYGHHMRDGSMFAALDNYQSESYYKEHPMIQFDSLYEMGDYEIFAVFNIPSTELDKLSSFILFKNKEQFEQLMDFVDSYKFYDTDIDCEYGNKLLTLMTCEYSNKNGRIFVIAQKIN